MEQKHSVCVNDNKTGTCYNINKLDEFESNEQFNKRVEFIKLNSPHSKEQFELLITMSEIYVYRLTLGCKYSAEIEEAFSKFKIPAIKPPQNKNIHTRTNSNNKLKKLNANAKPFIPVNKQQNGGGYDVDPRLPPIGGMVQYSFYPNQRGCQKFTPNSPVVKLDLYKQQTPPPVINYFAD